jgi:hypothetical protein
LFNGNKGDDIIVIDRLTQSPAFSGQGADSINLATLFDAPANGNQGNDLVNVFPELHLLQYSAETAMTNS